MNAPAIEAAANATNLDENQRIDDFVIDFTRLLYLQYQEVDNSIRHADLKAQLIVGINAILLAAVTNASGLFSVIGGDTTAQPLPTQVGFILNLNVLTCLLLSIFYSLSTIIPRFKTADTVNSVFFFGDIIKLKQADYVQRYTNMTLKQYKEEMIAQIHAKSFIVDTKFRKVRVSLLFLYAAMFFWALEYLFTLL